MRSHKFLFWLWWAASFVILILDNITIHPGSLLQQKPTQANGWTGGKLGGKEFPATTFALSSSDFLAMWVVWCLLSRVGLSSITMVIVSLQKSSEGYQVRALQCGFGPLSMFYVTRHSADTSFLFCAWIWKLVRSNWFNMTRFHFPVHRFK